MEGAFKNGKIRHSYLNKNDFFIVSVSLGIDLHIVRVRVRSSFRLIALIIMVFFGAVLLKIIISCSQKSPFYHGIIIMVRIPIDLV